MDITIALFFLAILLFSIVIHEYSHAYVAYSLGDPTAKYAGRLTLNPIPHIDFIGTIILPAVLLIISAPFLLGWAKPVPINPYNLRDQKYGEAKVAIAGPASNILIVLAFSGLIYLITTITIFLPLLSLVPFFGLIIFINILLALFNLLPIPPLDGSHILFAFLPASMQSIKISLAKYGIFFLLGFILLGGLGLLFPIISFVFYLFAGFSLNLII